MVIPVLEIEHFFQLDEYGRVVLGQNLCGKEYGSDIVGGVREYPVNAPLFGSYTFVPLSFIRNNFHFFDLDNIGKNTGFVQNFTIEGVDLHAILLSRGGPYGFCSWKQLQHHAMNPEVRMIRNEGVIDWNEIGKFDKTLLEGPIFGSSICTDGLLGKLDSMSKDTVFTDVFGINSSFANDVVMFNNIDKTLRFGGQPYKLPTSLDLIKNDFYPSKDGKSVEINIKDNVLLRRGNPEQKTSEKTIVKKLQLGKIGSVLKLSHAEIVFPDRFSMFRKFPRVRELYRDGWEKRGTDKMFDFVFGWSGHYKKLTRTGEIETSQTYLSQNYIKPASRWPLTSRLYSIDSPSISLRSEDRELGECVFYKYFNSSNDISPSPRFSFVSPKFFPNEEDRFFRDFVYRVNKQLSMSPFYDSYEDFLNTVKMTAQRFSLIPSRDGVVDGIPKKIVDYAYDSVGFSSLGQFEREIPNTLQKYSLTVSLNVIKKLWLKRGFFPVERIVQISRYLFEGVQKTLYGIFEFSPETIKIKPYTEMDYPTNILQSFIDHFVSPGILFNTLKSSIAVGYPVYRMKKDVNGRMFFYNLHYTSGTNPVLNRLLGTVPDHYIPFETLFDVFSYFRPIYSDRQKSISVLETKDVYQTSAAVGSIHSNDDICSQTAAFCFYGSSNKIKTFESANKNFFAEIVKFFIKDGETTYFESKRESEFLSAEAGTVYYMDVVLSKRDVVLCEGPSVSGLSERGSVYGPPINPDPTLPYSIPSNLNSYVNKLDKDPAYCAYTPPYFYGDAVARISFDPMEADPNLRLGETKRFSLDDILKNCKQRLYRNTNVGGYYINDNNNVLYLPRFNEDLQIFDGLYNTISWIDYYNSSDYPIIFDKLHSRSTQAPLFYTSCMDIDKSVFLFNKKRNLDQNEFGALERFNTNFTINKNNEYSWCIETKFESPVLDFSMHNEMTLDSMPEKNKNGEYVPSVYSARPRGLWFDFGVEPRKDAGIFLELRESFPELYQENKSVASLGSIDFDSCFSSEPALLLYWIVSDYEFPLNPPGFKMPVYLVSNTDTTVYFTSVVNCNAAGSVDFEDTSWLTGKEVKRGHIYEVILLSKTPSLCPPGNVSYTTIQATNGFCTSRNCRFILHSTPTEGCSLSSSQEASSSFRLESFVVSNPDVYQSLLYQYERGELRKQKKVGSLIKLCGFSCGKKKVGIVKDSSELAECVAVVPYVLRNGQKEYFYIDQKVLNEQIDLYHRKGVSYVSVYGDEIKKTSLVDLYCNVKKYWFPEKFDFVYAKATPCVMFTFEVSMKLSKEELISLWQNVLPTSLRKQTIETIEKEFHFEAYELLGEKDFPEDVRFEIFSAPLRSEQEYTSILHSESAKENISVIEHNWPHSFYRIAEYGQVSIKKTYEL